MSLAGRVGEARRGRGLTQQEVADAIGVDKARISEWETGRVEPSVDSLARICRALHVSGHWLLTGDGPMEVAEPGEAERLLARVRKDLCHHRPPGVIP